MSVIKFIDNSKPITVSPKPSVEKIFSAELVYGAKENLPKSLSRSQFLITTDTHEIYRGNSVGEPELFNAIEIYDSINKFPKKAIESKMYLDRESGALFFFAGGQYRQVGAGEGVVVSPNSEDVRVGELSQLATDSKKSIVEAINEVIKKMPVVDLSGVATEKFVEDKLKDIPKVDVSGLATKQELKQELEKAIKDVEVAAPSLEGYATEAFVSDKIEKINIPSTEGLASKSEVKVVQDGLSQLKDTVNSLSLEGANIDLAGYAQLTDVYTKSEVDRLVPSVEGLVKTTDVYTKTQVYTKTEVNNLIPKVDGLAKTTDVYTKTQVDSLIPSIVGLATEAQLTGKADKSTVDQLKTKVDNLVVITTQEKQKYEAYEALIANLNGDISLILNRIGNLEKLQSEGGSTTKPSDPQEPNVPSNPDGVEFIFDFTLPTAEYQYDLLKDPKWVAAGHSYDPANDAYGDILGDGTQKMFVYYTGTAATPITDESKYILLPRTGAEELVEQGNRGWSVLENTQIIEFSKAGLTDYKYRIVKYA